MGALATSPQTHLSLRSATQAALEKSDNTALNVIKYYSEPRLGEEEQSLSYLKLKPVQEDGLSYINAKSYVGILSCLYESCYNTPADSQEMLDYLSQSHFPGIADGVPSSVQVAHKIGTAMETHDDCGIVYLPLRPYILCVMVNQPRQTYAKTMKDVSAIVYGEVVAAHTTK